MTAYLMHGDTRRELLNSIVEFDSISEYFSHHRKHVAFAERNAQHLMTHAAAGGVGHLGVLDVIARIGEQVVVAGMIPVHVGGDHVINLVGCNTERLQALAYGMNDGARAFLGGGFVEAGIADKRAVRPLDHPDVIRDRCHLIMRIAENVIFRALACMRRVADRIDLVDVVAHDFLPTVTPARFSIILTIAVKSLSAPYSLLVVSH